MKNYVGEQVLDVGVVVPDMGGAVSEQPRRPRDRDRS
jgi:hypothetical protein